MNRNKHGNAPFPLGALRSLPAQASTITAGNREPQKHASVRDLALAMQYRRRLASASGRVASAEESVPKAVAAHAARETHPSRRALLLPSDDALDCLAALVNYHDEIAAPAADVIPWAIMDAPHPAGG